ncbi:MFS general substrate transporter [Cerioporus squamosus]|nr:MFS general substrate transporter [Cerioporus squamosus]
MSSTDELKGSIELVESVLRCEGTRTDGPSAAEERRLVRKLDMRIMPMLCIMYLFAYLDRINLGNARLQGLPQDVLHGDPTGVLFDWVNSAFYFSYILCPVPAVLLAKLCPPRIWFGCAALGWGVCSLLTAAFSPGVPIYLSLFYKKEEIGLRIAVYNGFAAAAGAFGGLIAFAIQQARLPIPNWKLLFIVEGAPSILIGLLVFVVLPNRPEETSMFTEEERAIALNRLIRSGKPDLGRVLRKSTLAIPRRAHDGIDVYAAGVIYFATNCAFSSIAAFLPTIITTFGFTNALAQLLTIPPYVVSTTLLCSCAYASDKLQSRGKFVIAFSALAGTGYILLLAVPFNNHVRYFATFCITSGTYGMICTTLAWFAQNLGSETKRATAMPLFQAIGQCGSILGSHVYPLTEGPRYLKGFAIDCALDFLAALVALVLMVSYRAENKRRDRLYGVQKHDAVVDTSELADRASGFRYTL